MALELELDMGVIACSWLLMSKAADTGVMQSLLQFRIVQQALLPNTNLCHSRAATEWSHVAGRKAIVQVASALALGCTCTK